MPWVVRGNCVYKKNPDGTTGKKAGCSDSAAAAKQHLKALYANVGKEKAKKKK